MPLFLQKILAFKDRRVSRLFKFPYQILSKWAFGEPPTRTVTYYVDRGPATAIVGVDGNIRSMFGRCAVRHEYRENRLVRRILLRKSLAPGERLATPSEIATFKEQLVLNRHGIWD